MPAKPKFDPAQSITDEVIAHLERGVMPWRRPWHVAPSPTPLRVGGEPYQGINNFLLTMRANLAGYTSPYWMTMRQANTEGARIRKGQKSSVVVYYGTAYKDAGGGQDPAHEDEDSIKAIPFMKSYRVFNAHQIDGLPDGFFPEPGETSDVVRDMVEPIPHIQKFFDRIGARVQYGGNDASFVPALDKIRMPHLEDFKSSMSFYAVLGHEHIHWTKMAGRLNRVYGHSRFGNTAYAREEIVAELGTLFLGQQLGYAPAQMELSVAYLNSWLHVLRADKRAIFKHAGDATKAAAYLTELSEAGAQDVAA